MKVILDKDAIRLAKGVDTSLGRPNLQQVHFKDKEMFVVDGFTMIRKQLQYEEDGKGVISAKILEKASGKLVTLSINDNQAEIYNGEYTIRVDTLDCTSPDINQIYRKNEKKATVALSAQVLTKLLKCLPPDCTISFRIAEITDPIEFKAKKDGNIVAEGLVMPFHADQSNIKWQSDQE